MRALLKFSGFLLGLFFVLLSGCTESAALREHVYQGGALGTSYSIKVFTPDTTDLQPAIDSVFRVVNQSLSTYLPDSDISRINSGDSGVQVDKMFAEVFNMSVEIYEQTDGYFDPTVGILVDAWGFGPGQALKMDSTRVDSLRQYVGLDKVRLTPDYRIAMQQPGMRLDFNAIAKGYAVDRLGVMLEDKGAADYLVEVGGELRTLGINQLKGQPWVVGIDDPRDSQILAVSVLAETCMRADGFATAFMAMELEASKRILEADDTLEGYIIYLDESGATSEYMTPGFKAVLQQD